MRQASRTQVSRVRTQFEDQRMKGLFMDLNPDPACAHLPISCGRRFRFGDKRMFILYCVVVTLSTEFSDEIANSFGERRRSSPIRGRARTSLSQSRPHAGPKGVEGS